jgi:hypothetical protein
MLRCMGIAQEFSARAAIEDRIILAVMAVQTVDLPDVFR